jgi:hypothetical protein
MVGATGQRNGMMAGFVGLAEADRLGAIGGARPEGALRSVGARANLLAGLAVRHCRAKATLPTDLDPAIQFF